MPRNWFVPEQAENSSWNKPICHFFYNGELWMDSSLLQCFCLKPVMTRMKHKILRSVYFWSVFMAIVWLFPDFHGGFMSILSLSRDPPAFCCDQVPVDADPDPETRLNHSRMLERSPLWMMENIVFSILKCFEHWNMFSFLFFVFCFVSFFVGCWMIFHSNFFGIWSSLSMT